MGWRTDLPDLPIVAAILPATGRHLHLPPSTLPGGPFSLWKPFSPEHHGCHVVCILPWQFTQIQSFRCVPRLHVSHAGDSWILRLQLLCPFIPSGCVQPRGQSGQGLLHSG